MLICVAVFRQDSHVLLWSFSVGIISAFVFLLFKARHFVFLLSNPLSQSVRESLQFAPGLLVLQGAHFFFVFSDRIFVSFLPTGSVSALAYAMTIVSLLPGLMSLSGSFITVIAEQENLQERSKLLNALLSMGVLLAIGVTGFLLMAGSSMVHVLLERDLFTAADTEIVTTAIIAFAWMILPLLLIGPLDQTFQVEKRIGLMVSRTAIGMITNIILNAWFLFGMGLGLVGIALATSISYWIMLIAGLHSLRQLGYRIDWSSHIKWCGWIMAFFVPTYIVYSYRPELLMQGLPNLMTSAFFVIVQC